MSQSWLWPMFMAADLCCNALKSIAMNRTGRCRALSSRMCFCNDRLPRTRSFCKRPFTLMLMSHPDSCLLTISHPLQITYNRAKLKTFPFSVISRLSFVSDDEASEQHAGLGIVLLYGAEQRHADRFSTESSSNALDCLQLFCWAESITAYLQLFGYGIVLTFGRSYSALVPNRVRCTFCLCLLVRDGLS